MQSISSLTTGSVRALCSLLSCPKELNRLFVASAGPESFAFDDHDRMYSGVTTEPHPNIIPQSPDLMCVGGLP